MRACQYDAINQVTLIKSTLNKAFAVDSMRGVVLFGINVLPNLLVLLQIGLNVGYVVPTSIMYSAKGECGHGIGS